MKRFFALATVSVALLSLSSCKKDYTCRCKFSGSTQDITAEFKDSKKSDAKASCDDLTTSYAPVGGSCSLD